MKKEETSIQNLIRIVLSEKGCITHRTNVGKFYTPDGRMITIGTPGQSDLFGHRAGDGKAFYIETKTPIGRLKPEQAKFLAEMKKSGAIAGVARTPEEATKLVFSEVSND